jgi:hypothetical protein
VLNEFEKNKFGKEEEEEKMKDDGRTKVSNVNTIMQQIREKEQFIRETFKNVNARSEIFFKFTGYSYKIASAWKLTLSAQKPLLPFSARYECMTLPKVPQISASRTGESARVF